MRIEKILETSLRILNPLSFARDLKGNILSMLNRDLRHKCFKGCYIEEIVDVIKYSEIMISIEGNRSDGKVDVMFKVLATVYYVGETITGATVTHKEKGIIFAETPTCKIFMNFHKTLETISEGQIISVRVGATQYSVYANQVSINAYPMLPIAKPTVYRLSPVDKSSPEIADALSRHDDAVKQLAAAKSTQPKSYEFFENLLSAYKTAPPAPPGAVVTEVSALVTSTGYASRGPGLPPTSSSVYVWKEAPSPPNEAFDGVASIVGLIEESTSQIRTLAEMTMIYDAAKITSHRNYWLTLIKSKLDTAG